MICYQTVLTFCNGDISKIENYDKAVNDDQMWHCHHRLETHKYKDRARKEWVKRDEDVPKRMLVAFGVYRNRPPEELIFLTSADHKRLHKNPMKGKHWSEEERKKISERHKGVPKSEEHKAKIAEALRGKPKSKEHLKKLSRKGKGYHWYNNGKVTTIARTCPEGFVPGRFIK